jgi:predicted kinase
MLTLESPVVGDEIDLHTDEFRFWRDSEVPALPQAALDGDSGGDASRRPRLIFAVGAARCGKSTFARRWLAGEYRHPEAEPRPRWVWNTDTLRERMTGRRYCRQAEPINYAIKHYAIAHSLALGFDVFVDGTHTSEESIRRLLELDADALPMVFATDEQECVRRAHATGQSDLVPVIARHWRNLRRLLDEGVDNVVARIRSEVYAR